MVIAPAAAPPISFVARPAARAWTCDAAPREDVAAFHRALPGYAPTPLVELPELAADLGAERLFVKDESFRLGLPAFKILGASWGVYRALCDRYGMDADVSTAADATDPLARLRARVEAEAPVRLVTATDGNHGRAVAVMARSLGLVADIVVPQGLHPDALEAISREGGRLTEVPGTYDEAVRYAADTAVSDASALLVQDIGWPGYERVARWIVDGYSTLFREIDEQLHAAGAGRAGLVAVPVGVGSLAQAAVVHYRAGRGGPALLAVEPEAAPCVLASLVHERPVTVGAGSTIMSGLNCATPSASAWPFLRAGLDAAVAVSDADAVRAAGELAALGVPAGPCGAASLAGIRAAFARGRLASGEAGTVVLLCTEGTAANPAVTEAPRREAGRHAPATR
ncbi:pyridoxal-phosphate dependent enzyme [Actinomadura fibrosa]|uniref:Pyridoxal-phosphate dependent enzyme n=1 Tax=Actinomadura fibrosa TaxID=111802 RepID=A0ABW2XEH4_9ACTN|nr:pyridoxal-phosphate dependent enzyme [Actinomadura fibrosa]